MNAHTKYFMEMLNRTELKNSEATARGDVQEAADTCIKIDHLKAAVQALILTETLERVF